MRECPESDTHRCARKRLMVRFPDLIGRVPTPQVLLNVARGVGWYLQEILYMCWSVGIWNYGARHITRLGAEVLDVMISPRQGIKPSEKRKPYLETGTPGPNTTDTHAKTSVLHSIKLDVILARRPKQSQDKSYLSDKCSQNALI